MASTSLVTAICERMIERLQKENPEVEYKHKPKGEKKCMKASIQSQRRELKNLKKPKLLN